MKRLMTLFAAATLLLTAQVQAASGRLAVLDVQQALLSSDAAASFRQELQQEFADEQQQLVDLEKQARALREKMQKNAGLSSEEEMQQLRMQFQKAFGEFQRRGQELQQQRAQREQAFLNEMRPRLDEIIRNLIKQQEIDLVLNKQAAIYANPELDITGRVVELLNQQ
jgi:outer membrane protein